MQARFLTDGERTGDYWASYARNQQGRSDAFWVNLTLPGGTAAVVTEVQVSNACGGGADQDLLTDARVLVGGGPVRPGGGGGSHFETKLRALNNQKCAYYKTLNHKRDIWTLLRCGLYLGTQRVLI